MRRLGWLALLALAACSPRVYLLGDSITGQYGVAFTADTVGTTVTNLGGGPGQDPVNYDWKGLLLAQVASFHPDHVVLQDYAIPGISPDNITVEQYRAAWLDLVQTAQANVPDVVVLVGCCDADFMRSLPADSWLDMVPADGPDGIHYLPPGAEAMSQLLRAHLGLP